MTIINSNEFFINQDKYFGLAAKEDIFVEKGKDMFLVTIANNNRRKKYLEPDEDFYRAITIDEFRELVRKDIHQIYSNKR
jgi:hypothetical protein